MRISAIVVIGMLCTHLLGVEPVSASDQIKQLLNGRYRLSVKSVLINESKSENGVIGSAHVELSDIETGNIFVGRKDVILKRFIRLTRWSAKIVEDSLVQRNYIDGWFIPDNVEAAIVFRPFRRFEIGKATVDVQVPENASYDFVRGILDFSGSALDLNKVYDFQYIEAESKVRIRTLNVYIDSLNASGDVYEVELNDQRLPVKIAKTGRWIS